MTLLVALANSECAVLVADRRVTCNGVLIDDEHNKMCILLCNDARLSIAYTGLATFQGFDTSEWLTRTLFEIQEVHKDVALILNELRIRANETLSGLGARDIRLTFIFCGFVYWAKEPEPRVYVLSNFEHGQLVGCEKFTLRTVCSDDSQGIVELAGMTDAVPLRTIESLRLLMKNRIPQASIVRFAVTHLRRAASHNKSLQLIGEQCNSAVIRAERDSNVVSTYHAAKNSYVAYGANVVIVDSMVSYGFQLFSPQVLSGPDIRKSDPCWCGSGEKFKHCHLKKFGALYVNSDMFSQPLSPIVSSEFDEPRPSGKRFVVTSRFD